MEPNNNNEGIKVKVNCVGCKNEFTLTDPATGKGFIKFYVCADCGQKKIVPESMYPAALRINR